MLIALTILAILSLLTGRNLVKLILRKRHSGDTKDNS